MAVDGAHDVPDLRLAARCQGKGFQPLFDLHGLHVRQTMHFPTWQNPLPQIALVSVLRGIRLSVLVLGDFLRGALTSCLGGIFRVGDNARSKQISFNCCRGVCSLMVSVKRPPHFGVGLGLEFWTIADHYFAISLRSIGLDLVPSEYPKLFGLRACSFTR